MHFLCLHGMGTNSQIFEMQTAALRYELGDKHTYDFVEGTIPHPMAPGIAALVPQSTETFTYIDKTSPTNALSTLSDLRTHLSTDGPYDGVLAFSEGAALAAMFLIQSTTQFPNQAPPFRLAIFLSGGVPASPAALARSQRQLLNYAADGVQIQIPTAHVFGRNDAEYPDFGPVLRDLCEPEESTVFVHDGGHEVPGVGDKEGLAGAVGCVKRAVARAEERQ